MFGLMQEHKLLVSSLIEHAVACHPDAEIVSRTVEGPIHRCTYGDIHRRAKQVANALTALGVQRGDRVATLAWNGYRHMELYFGVSGMGAVLHTVNPRLFPEQLEYIINHAEDTVLFFDLSFVALVEKLLPRLKSVRAFVVMTDRAHMPECAIPGLLCYEDLLAAPIRHLRLARPRRERRRLAVLHLGHHRHAQGRAVFAPLDRAARLRRLHRGQPGRVEERNRVAGGADVPRQRLEHALRRRHERRQAGPARPGPGRRERVPVVARRAGHARTGRAHGLDDAAAARRGGGPEADRPNWRCVAS